MSKLRIAVLGYIVRMPLGGMSWHYLQYVLAAQRLGHEVSFIEFSDDDPWSCYDPTTGINGDDPRYGLRYASQAFDRLGLANRWAFYDGLRNAWHGPLADLAPSLGNDTDVVLNVSAANPIEPWFEDTPTRVMIDTDPLFSQIRTLTDPDRAALAAAHNRYFTFGVNIAAGTSSVPDDGIDWKPTVQPVVLDQWPISEPPGEARVTTIMQWDSYASLTYHERKYEMKAASFGPYIDLPERTMHRLEIALGSPGAPRRRLEDSGWNVRDPLEVTRDPWEYQRYIQTSRAEFSVAKHGYVSSRTGWFSERSANYLATGRPVVLQDTGFTNWLESGSGVIPFTNSEEAVAALDDLAARYEHHRSAARQVAEEYFHAERVLTDLLSEAVTADE